MVVGDCFVEDSLWDIFDVWQRVELFSIWGIGNELKIFIVCSGLKKLLRRFVLKLVDQDLFGGIDNMVICVEIGIFFVVFFDDYGGLVRKNK